MMRVPESQLFENARANWDSKYPFVLYCKPNAAYTVGLFQKDATIHLVKDFSETGYVFAPFHHGNRFLIPEGKSHFMVSTIKSDALVLDELEINDTGSAKPQHLQLVQNGIDAIHQKKFTKVVLSRSETVALSAFDFEIAFRSLLYYYPNAFVYCWFHPETGLWMGAFSELLLKANGKEITTMAVAGTQKWHEGEISWQEKEKQEQQIVTDFITQSLAPFCDSVQKSEAYTLQAGNLAHIKTDIGARLKKQTRIADIIDALHPTPAVCGMPKFAAMDFILQKEKYDREFYSGFHGEINKDFLSGEKQTHLFVNLRCMKVSENTVNLYVGGGITKDSDPEKEWMETVSKAQTIKRVLHLKQQL